MQVNKYMYLDDNEDVWMRVRYRKDGTATKRGFVMLLDVVVHKLVDRRIVQIKMEVLRYLHREKQHVHHVGY